MILNVFNIMSPFIDCDVTADNKSLHDRLREKQDERDSDRTLFAFLFTFIHITRLAKMTFRSFFVGIFTFGAQIFTVEKLFFLCHNVALLNSILTGTSDRDSKLLHKWL
jgi:hypothetical protein